MSAPDRSLVDRARARALGSVAALSQAQRASGGCESVISDELADLAATIAEMDAFAVSMHGADGDIAAEDYPRYDERMADFRVSVSECAVAVLSALLGAKGTDRAVTFGCGPAGGGSDVVLPNAETGEPTDLVSMVDLGARWGWQLEGAENNRLSWTRAANRIIAVFAGSSQRVRYAALLNYTVQHDTGAAEFGTAVWRGIGNGGDRAEALDSLGKWFRQEPRQLDGPTQW